METSVDNQKKDSTNFFYMGSLLNKIIMIIPLEYTSLMYVDIHDRVCA